MCKYYEAASWWGGLSLSRAKKLEAAAKRKSWPESLLISLLFAERRPATFLVHWQRCVTHHHLLLIDLSQNSRHCPEHIQNTATSPQKLWELEMTPILWECEWEIHKTKTLSLTPPLASWQRGNRSKSLRDEQQSNFYTNRELPVYGLAKSVHLYSYSVLAF